MDHIKGRVFKDPSLPGMTREERQQIYTAMCDVLVRIHNVNISAAGLDDYGRKGKLSVQCGIISVSGNGNLSVFIVTYLSCNSKLSDFMITCLFFTGTCLPIITVTYLSCHLTCLSWMIT